MNAVRVLAMLAAILICIGSSSAAAEDESKSFVDKMFCETLPFEEDSADEFMSEKREINRLCAEAENPDFDAAIHEVNVKLQELKAKAIARYGENYEDWDAAFLTGRLLSWSWESTFTENLGQRLSVHKGDLIRALQDDKTWADFQSEIDEVTRGFNVPLELNFRMDHKIVTLCREKLGEDDPATLKRTINLIRDYSLMGDSKTALAMELKIVMKVSESFGEKSNEVAELLSLMAYDCKTLGLYQYSEDLLLKAIAINRELHGEEHSPELLANLVALIDLRKVSPASDVKLYGALEKAARGLSDDDLYRLGYKRFEILNDPVNDAEKLVKLSEACTRERNLIEGYRGYDYIKAVDMSLEQAESAKVLGWYAMSFTDDLMAMADCKLNLGKYHHKTLVTLCNLSDDYLALNQPDDALELAQKAYYTSREIYGDRHPCTIRAIHSLTNVYRHEGRFSDALSLDGKAYELSKSVFVKGSAGEPSENLTILADIADDYNGLRDYPSAIKFCEEYLSKYTARNSYDPEVAQVRKNLALLYNIGGKYAKTVKLYDFLRQKDGSYSLAGLLVGGLTAGHTADVFGIAAERRAVS